jgi:hypothetical protein
MNATNVIQLGAAIIAALSAVIAACSFVSGVSAWKREFIGKRRIELAESVLAMFYEAEVVIRDMRNPFSSIDEVKSRVHADNETKEDSRRLNQAYVFSERYQKHEKLFAELRSMEYRFRATFGAEAGEPFQEMHEVLNEIFRSARMLINHYWEPQVREFMSDDESQKHLEATLKHEAVFYCLNEEDEDTISLRMRNAVQKVENITEDVVKTNSGTLFSRKSLSRYRR